MLHRYEMVSQDVFSSTLVAWHSIVGARKGTRAFTASDQTHHAAIRAGNTLQSILARPTPRSIETRKRETYHDTANKQDESINHKQAAPLPIPKPLPLEHIKPEQARQTQREPRAKQRPEQPDQVAEHGYRTGDDPRQHPSRHTQRDPAAPGAHAVLAHDARPTAPVAPDLDVHVFDDDAGVDDTRDDNSGHCDGPGDLGDDGARRREGRRGDVEADVPVDDDGDDDVEADCHCLQQRQSLGEVLRAVHFRDEAEKGDVAGVGHDDVGDGRGAVGEAGFAARGYGVEFWVRGVGYADADHGYDDCGCDRKACCCFMSIERKIRKERGSKRKEKRARVTCARVLTDNGEPGNALECPRDGQRQGDDCAHEAKDNRASAVVGENIHLDAKGQDMRRHDEDQDQSLHDLDYPFPNGPEDHVGCIGKAVYAHVPALELVNDVASVRGHEAEASYEYDAWDEANSRDNFRERQYTKGNGLSDEQGTGAPP